MKCIHLIAIITLAFNTYNMSAQTVQNRNNPLLCDPDSGICEMPNTADKVKETVKNTSADPVRIIYFTDPICSSCWGIEPQLRKLKLVYGNDIEVEYRMGGLLPDWSYNSGGISKPSDVAHHWDEVSAYYDMPIDGDIWLEDPLDSSYPPSIAFKAAQMQDHHKALLFLRVIREMVFLQKKNITRWEHLELAAQEAGLDTQQLRKDFEGTAKTLFNEDLALGKAMGVRGFPTMFFTDTTGKTTIVYGSKPYAEYENALLKTCPDLTPYNYQKHWKDVFAKYPTLTAREYAELMEIPRATADKVLDDLVAKGVLEKQDTKNGAIWRLVKTD